MVGPVSGYVAMHWKQRGVALGCQERLGRRLEGVAMTTRGRYCWLLVTNATRVAVGNVLKGILPRRSTQAGADLRLSVAQSQSQAPIGGQAPIAA